MHETSNSDIFKHSKLSDEAFIHSLLWLSSVSEKTQKWPKCSSACDGHNFTDIIEHICGKQHWVGINILGNSSVSHALKIHIQ